MLPIKGILALYYPHMGFCGKLLPGLLQYLGQFKIRCSRPFYRCIFLGGSLHTDGRLGNHQISRFYGKIHPSRCTYTDKNLSSAGTQLFQGNRSGGSAYTGGTDTDLFPQKSTGISHILSSVCHQFRIVKIFRNLFTALRISGKENIFPQISLFYSDMITAFIF